jgi:hypothetical protein
MKVSILTFLFLVSQLLSFADDCRMMVGGQLGLPAGLNISFGCQYYSSAVNISGVYVGDYDNAIMKSGLQIEISRYLKKAKFSHRLSIMAGQAIIGDNSSDPLNYLALGYAAGWKNFYMQPGAAFQVLGSKNGSFNEVFPFLNIGCFFPLFKNAN